MSGCGGGGGGGGDGGGSGGGLVVVGLASEAWAAVMWGIYIIETQYQGSVVWHRGLVAPIII